MGFGGFVDTNVVNGAILEVDVDLTVVVRCFVLFGVVDVILVGFRVSVFVGLGRSFGVVVRILVLVLVRILVLVVDDTLVVLSVVVGLRVVVVDGSRVVFWLAVIGIV